MRASGFRAFRPYRRSQLWVVPGAGAVLALLLAAVSLSLDHLAVTREAPFPVFRGTPEIARGILSLIATSPPTSETPSSGDR